MGLVSFWSSFKQLSFPFKFFYFCTSRNDKTAIWIIWAAFGFFFAIVMLFLLLLLLLLLFLTYIHTYVHIYPCITSTKRSAVFYMIFSTIHLDNPRAFFHWFFKNVCEQWQKISFVHNQVYMIKHALDKSKVTDRAETGKTQTQAKERRQEKKRRAKERQADQQSKTWTLHPTKTKILISN